MSQSPKQFGWTGLVLAGLVSLWPAPGGASQASLGVYEDWRESSTLRSDRWLVREDGLNQEVALGLQGHRLIMRHRRQGQTASDTGATSGIQALLLTRTRANIDQIEVDLRVSNIEVTGCPDNPGSTVVLPARVAVGTFNDGTPGANQTGDHFIRVLASAPADGIDASSLLTVQGALVRCISPDCTVSGPVSSVELARLPLARQFTLRAAWDRPNHRVLVGVNDDPDVELAYDPALDVADARVPFAAVRSEVVTANCTAGPTVADVQLEVSEVRTNTSAIVP